MGFFSYGDTENRGIGSVYEGSIPRIHKKKGGQNKINLGHHTVELLTAMVMLW